MSPSGTVARDGPLRLFCALTLPHEVRDALAVWQRSLRAGEARLVDADALHVTLAFLGWRPAADVAPVADALRTAVAMVPAPPVFEPLRYRETRSVGMLVLADREERAGRLAAQLQEALERLGVYTPESRPWLPHVTVLRFRRPPRLSPLLPELSAFSPSEAAVYHSVLRPGGARYQTLESVPLGG